MSHTTTSMILGMRLGETDLPIASENFPFTPKADQLYVREQYLGDSPIVRQLVGGRHNNRGGLYRITVMAPMDGTKFPGRKAVDLLEDTFSPGYRKKMNGVTVSVVQTSVGNAFTVGDRFAIPVTVEFLATGNEV